MLTNRSRQTIRTLLFIVIIVSAGITLGFFYERLPSNNPQESQKGCESVGGEWDTGSEKCLISYKKAGESCTDGGQCVSGICTPPMLTAEQQVAIFDGPLTSITGTCSADKDSTGCVPQVIKGTVSKESMCLD